MTDTINPTDADKAYGWSVNVKLITEIEKILTYPMHSQAIEQVILELKRRDMIKEPG